MNILANNILKLNPLRYFSGNSPLKAVEYTSKLSYQPIYNYFIEFNKSISPNDMFMRYQTLIKEVQDYEKNNILLKSHNNQHRVALKMSSFDFNKNYINTTVKMFLHNNWQVIIDAENNSNHEHYQILTNSLISEYNQSQTNIIKTYQMYRKDALHELQNDLYYCNSGFLGVKLVRGAYWKEDKNLENYLLQKKKLMIVIIKVLFTYMKIIKIVII